jgi:hypothetical protein
MRPQHPRPPATGTSACSITNGGCTITLSDDFAMGSYSGEIEFSGKAFTIWGQRLMPQEEGVFSMEKGVARSWSCTMLFYKMAKLTRW